jgi:hypothetical protein
MLSKKFFLMAIALENATQLQLDNLSQRINEVFRKYTQNGVITDPVQLANEVNKIVDQYYDVFVEHLQVSSGNVGRLRAFEALTAIMPRLRNAGLYTEAIDFYNQIATYGDDVAKRLMYNGWSGTPLNQTIKTIREGTQKTVRNIIGNGVSEGKSAKEISKMIEQYVNPIPGEPKIQPYQEYRKAFGRPQDFTPKGVPAGSVQFNSMRIARTETAHIYRQATTDFYDGRDWVKGFKWVLSNRHKGTDICDEYAAQTYETGDDIPTSHPHCLCDVQPLIMTQKEMKELRFAYEGELGNPYRDSQGRFSNEVYGKRLEKKLESADKQIKTILANRPENLRKIEQSTKNMSDKQRLVLAKGDRGQAGLQSAKSERDKMLEKFRKMASGQ